jgi:hypothetical protein
VLDNGEKGSIRFNFVHEITHLLDCIVNDKDVALYGATFEDGCRAAVICDAILESAAFSVN